MKATAPQLVSGLALVGVTYLLTGAIGNAIQTQQAQTAAVKEMQPLLLKLADGGTDLADAKAAALAVSAFGTPAIGPLLSVLRAGGQNRTLAAGDGLRAIGLVSSQDGCKSFGTVLDNRTRLFTWQSQLEIIRIAGELGCADLLPSLRRLANLAARSLRQPDLNPYSTIVGNDLSREGLKALQDALTRAIQLVQQQTSLQG